MKRQDKPSCSYIRSSRYLFASLGSCTSSMPCLTPPRLSQKRPSQSPQAPAFLCSLAIRRSRLSSKRRPTYPMQSSRLPTSVLPLPSHSLLLPPPFTSSLAAIVPHVTTHPLSLSLSFGFFCKAHLVMLPWRDRSFSLAFSAHLPSH